MHKGFVEFFTELSFVQTYFQAFRICGQVKYTIQSFQNNVEVFHLQLKQAIYLSLQKLITQVMGIKFKNFILTYLVFFLQIQK